MDPFSSLFSPFLSRFEPFRAISYREMSRNEPIWGQEKGLKLVNRLVTTCERDAGHPFTIVLLLNG